MSRRKTLPGSGREGWHISLGHQDYQFLVPQVPILGANSGVPLKYPALVGENGLRLRL